MNHNRVEMLAALNLVRPALAAKDLIEELTHVWFDGETLTAYNDADLGIQAPFKSPFTGGIRGSLLLGLVQNSRAKEIIFELTDNEGEVRLKAARAKVVLSVLPPERAVFELPDVSSTLFKFDGAFVTALKSVLIAVGNDTSMPEKMGVTMVVGKGFLDLYATDSKSVAHAQVKAGDGKLKHLKVGARYILPTAFCEQVLRLCSSGGAFDFQKDIVTAQNESVFIWARLVDPTNKPMDFPDSISRHSEFEDDAVIPIPGRLTLALERALTMLDGLPDEPITIIVDADVLRIEVLTEGRGHLKDSVKLDATVPSLTFRILPVMIKRAMSLTTHMAMTKKAIWMSNMDGFSYLAATKGGA